MTHEDSFDPTLSLVIAGPLGRGARHGLRKLREALQLKGVSFEEVNQLSAARGDDRLVIGCNGAPPLTELLDRVKSEAPSSPEALMIQSLTWQSQPVWIAAGSDDRGLMYALLDIADRVGWTTDPQRPLSTLREAREAPEVVERSLSIYTMHKADFERRFYNEPYWARYLDMLAQQRFNTFALLFAYESAGYFAPPYPYFFDVAGFPDVAVAGYTPEMQARNLQALNRLIAMTHERGLDFTLGIWDHIYRGGVQSGGVQQDEDTLRWRVVGVTEENLVAYSVAALTGLLQRVPNLDALQFRMHGESGLTPEEMDVFWAQIYDVILTHAPHVRFDARAKGFPDHLIDLALEKGVNIRITTKYWMEQMGLPFHPTHIHPQDQRERRHSYADLLRYPQRYKMHWRLWNGGTSRVLLWGDPDYVRRFVASTHLYDGEGFDVNEPLATKMAAHEHDAPPFELLKPPYRYYDWEFERYWHFFQLFGRLGYNPATPAEVWEHEFTRRFGPAGEHLMRGLHLASRILPRIVAYTYPYHLFPTTRGWIAKQRMEDLPTYAAALPSDTQQFLSIADEARRQLEGGASAKIRPQRSAAWFDAVAGEVLRHVQRAEAIAGDGTSAELISTVTDLKILAHLARYHARRAHAGVQWALYEQSQDVNALDAAIDFEKRAIAAWEDLVAAADDVYADNLMMGLESADLSGHWRDELAALRHGLAELEAVRDAYQPPTAGKSPWMAHVPVRTHAPGEAIKIQATVSRAADLEAVRICYTTDGATPHCTAMAPTGAWRYEGTIPGEAVHVGLSYYLEAVDITGRRSVYPTGGESGPIIVHITEDNQPPTIEHKPVLMAPADQPLAIRATVRDDAGVAWVRLRYRPVSQFADFKSLMMVAQGSDVYEIQVPAEDLDPRWDFMYLIEAVDRVGNGTIHPDLEETTPYVVVRLQR